MPIAPIVLIAATGADGRSIGVVTVRTDAPPGRAGSATPRRRRGGRVVTAGLVLAVLSCPAGCARVEVAIPERAGDPACVRASTRWPDRVQGRDRVGTSADSPAVAAWGDPAVIARCGLPMPGPTTDECIVVDGVDWVARRVEDGMVFLTYGRDPAIQVLVPSAYAPEPMVLPLFGAAARQIPQGRRRCS